MKRYSSSFQLIARATLAVVALLAIAAPVFANGAPPPPTGVPFDGGLTALAAAAVGYGARKLYKSKA